MTGILTSPDPMCKEADDKTNRVRSNTVENTLQDDGPVYEKGKHSLF